MPVYTEKRAKATGVVPSHNNTFEHDTSIQEGIVNMTRRLVEKKNSSSTNGHNENLILQD